MVVKGKDEAIDILMSGGKKVITRKAGKWMVTNQGSTYAANFVVVSDACHIYGSQITTYGKVTLYK